jgi:hypothetical protein
MSKSTKKSALSKIDDLNETAKELFIYVFILFLLVAASFNVTTFLQPKKIQVLGAETQDKTQEFWSDFLTKNPSYIPGWIELGRTDKVKEIDPNYSITP